MKLWLDDMREPPKGWTLVTSVEDAKKVLQTQLESIVAISLDHDLGACEDCLKKDWAPWCRHPEGQTGYNLVSWMEENKVWPKCKPTVHSANPVGKARMESVINRHYDRKNENEKVV